MNNSAVELQLAPLGRRTLALVLDGLILLIPVAIANSVIPVLGGLAVFFFYAPVLESSEVRATLGKHMMGIQVADLSLRRVSFRAALIRNIVKFFSAVLLFVGFVFALFTERQQTLHDLLTDTLVIYGRSGRSVWDAWLSNVKELFGQGSDTVSRLERLQRLREHGVLSEEEFLREKEKIMSS